MSRRDSDKIRSNLVLRDKEVEVKTEEKSQVKEDVLVVGETPENLQVEEMAIVSGSFKSSDTPYDKCFGTLIRECPQLLVPLVNEMFGLDFSEEAKVTLLDLTYTEVPLEKNSGKRFPDGLFKIEDPYHPDYDDYRFLMECETWPNSEMEIRFFRYGSLNAIRHTAKDEEGFFHFTFPHLGLLYLRPGQRASRKNKIYVGAQGVKEELSIPLAVRTIKGYDKSTLMEKNLFFLMPFWAFKVASPEMWERDKFKLLHEECEPLIRWIAESMDPESGKKKFSGYVGRTIFDAFLDVFEAFTAGSPSVIEEVNKMIGDDKDRSYVQEYHELLNALAAKDEALTTLTQGIMQMSEGVEKEKLMNLLESLQNGAAAVIT